MKGQIQLLTTEDGSHTLYAEAIGENYHSTHGAVAESLHVFINAGLKQCVKEKVRVLEVGFGTGLNAYLAALAAGKRKQVLTYVGIEKYPLSSEMWSSLNYPASCGQRPDLFEQIHRTPWNKQVELTPCFSLKKIDADFTSIHLEGEFDVIFYDAFSPKKQPELWTEEVFEKLYKHTAEGGILTTYCAKGTVRRAMQAAGYAVERIPGPKGKREMLRATK